eukprot:1159375-Pelagomonas_calceolata.AAC.2
MAAMSAGFTSLRIISARGEPKNLGHQTSEVGQTGGEVQWLTNVPSVRLTSLTSDGKVKDEKTQVTTGACAYSRADGGAHVRLTFCGGKNVKDDKTQIMKDRSPEAYR